MLIVGDASKSRLVAVFIDHLIAFGLMMLVVGLVPPEFPALKAVLFFLVYLAYYFVLETLWSRTLGKFFQGLVIRKLDGGPLDWKAAMIRTVTRLVEVNPLLLGGLPAGIAIVSSERKQRVGDLLAGTLVVPTSLKWNSESDQLVAEPMDV